MSSGVHRASIGSALFVAAVFAGGCGAAEGVAQEGEDELGQQEEALIQPHNWGRAPSPDIDVCWRSTEFRASNLVTFRKNVRNWVEQYIGRVSNLRFHGWGECPPAGAAQYIQFNSDNGPTDITKGGYQDGSSKKGFQSSGPTQINILRVHMGPTSGGQRQGDRGVILHEFMHALGFAHEFNRSENSVARQCHWQAVEIGDTFDTPFDIDSLMNFSYCDGASSVLSPWDVVGLRRAYGHKPYLSMVGVSNKCLDIENPSMSPPTEQTRVQAYACLENANQMWFPGAVSGSSSWTFLSLLHALQGGSHVIMNVNGGTTNGTPITNSNFTDSANQQWKLQGMEIVGIGEMCLDAPGFAGAVPSLRYCNGSSNQRWDIFRNTSGNNGTYIRHSASPNVCLAKNGATGLALRTCDFASNPQPESQRWQFGTGHIFQDSQACVDVLWATPAQGQTVQVIPCRATDGSDRLNDAQRWYFRGPIRGLGNKCLDIISPSGPPIADGTKVALWDCTGGANQRFDFHF